MCGVSLFHFAFFSSFFLSHIVAFCTSCVRAYVSALIPSLYALPGIYVPYTYLHQVTKPDTGFSIAVTYMFLRTVNTHSLAMHSCRVHASISSFCLPSGVLRCFQLSECPNGLYSRTCNAHTHSLTHIYNYIIFI